MALNGRVLLLNQTYEPLGTVSVARAIIMTFKNTVFVEEWDGDRVLRSAHDEFPVASRKGCITSKSGGPKDHHKDTKARRRERQLTWLFMILCVHCVFVVNAGLGSDS